MYSKLDILKQLRHVDDVSETDPQRAMLLLVSMSHKSMINLNQGLRAVTSRGGDYLNCDIDTLINIHKQWKDTLGYDHSHNNSGMVDQDNNIIKTINEYMKYHTLTEWTILHKDFAHNEYSLAPIDKYVVSALTFELEDKHCLIY